MISLSSFRKSRIEINSSMSTLVMTDSSFLNSSENDIVMLVEQNQYRKCHLRITFPAFPRLASIR